MKIVKTAEGGKIAGISFTITGNGVNETVQTNSAGEIQIGNLAPGSYTVSEQSFDEYKLQGSYHSLIPTTAKAWGLNVEGCTAKEPQRILDALSQGKLVVFKGAM